MQVFYDFVQLELWSVKAAHLLYFVPKTSAQLDSCQNEATWADSRILRLTLKINCHFSL